MTLLALGLGLGLAASSCSAANGLHIYVATTSAGLPSYTDEPLDADSRLYMTLAEPPARPRRPRLSSAALPLGLPVPNAYAGIVPTDIRRLSQAASAAYGVPHALVLAVMHAESAFRADARSPVGAIGLMQIMPPTGSRYGVRTGLAEPRNNIDVGTRYLKDLLTLFKGDVELALAAYNAGEGAVMRHGMRIPPYSETRAYVPRVMSLYAHYRQAGAP